MKIFVLAFLFITINLFSQSLSGKKICLDPGHGFVPGQAYLCSDAETKRFESYINHYVIPHVKYYLQGAGAQVITTRADYDSIGPCITLSQREAVANNNNVHYFHSVHHNAFNGTSNYTLVLFEQLNNNDCPNGNPQWPGQADVMANLMSQKIHQAFQTTSSIYRGDRCFLGFNLGVLNDLNMPGTLSEASFYDYQPEIKRLKNLDYLRTEAEAIYHSFLQYYNAGFPSHGSLVGIVTNSTANHPAKNVTVTVIGTGKQYVVDNIGNGFYRIDTLPPGTYNLRVDGPLDSSFSSVTVTGGKINVKNLSITETQIVSNVKLNAVLGSNGAINVLWDRPAGTPDSIMIYLSEDGENFNEAPFRVVTGNNNGNIISGLDPNKAYYVKLKAKNSISESPNFSKVYGAYASSATEKLLIVDDFNSYSDSAGNGHNFVKNYGKTFADRNLKFETASSSAVSNASQFSAYKYAIWFTGNDLETISQQEQQILSSVLSSNLVFTGSNIGYDLDFLGSSSDKAFFNNYLEADYVNNNPSPNINYAAGEPASSFFGGLEINFGTEYEVISPDVISPTSGSQHIFNYNFNEKAAILIDIYKLYFAFPIESIADDSTRGELFNSIFSFFNFPNSNYDQQIIMPDRFSVTAYPNPFNPSTKLLVNVTEKDEYQIYVHNILGEKIASVYSGELTNGAHSFTVEMKNNSSGIYFVIVKSSNNFSSHKIMLMK